jgi:hypothetical protein
MKKVLLVVLALLSLGWAVPAVGSTVSHPTIQGTVQVTGRGELVVWGHTFLYDANTVFKTDSGRTASGIVPNDFVELTSAGGSDQLSKVVERKRADNPTVQGTVEVTGGPRPDGSGELVVWGHTFLYDANTVFKTDSGKTASGIVPNDFVELTSAGGSDYLSMVVEK